MVTAACSSTSGKKSAAKGEDGPKEVFAATKKRFLETSGFKVKLKGTVPEGGRGLLSGSGVASSKPSFKGVVKVKMDSIEADVDLVAVDGKVWAKLPYANSMAPLVPSEYGVPDPASLFDSAAGIGMLLDRATKVKAGKRTRVGRDEVQTYTGSVTGPEVYKLTTLGRSNGRYKMTVGIVNDEELRTLTLTGPFFEQGEGTYELTFTDYDTPVDVKPVK